MKRILLLLSISSVLFFSSCSSDDDPVPTHEVGEWELDSFILLNFPAGFQRNEGSVFQVGTLQLGGVVIEDYELLLNIDGTFSRDIGVAGPDLRDVGTWELNSDGDELTLTSDDGEDEQEWDVQRNETDQLWISQQTNSFELPDIYFDTVTQAYLDYLDTLTDDQLDSVDHCPSGRRYSLPIGYRTLRYFQTQHPMFHQQYGQIPPGTKLGLQGR